MEIAAQPTRRPVIVVAVAFVVLPIASVIANVGTCSVASSYIINLGKAP